MNDYRKPIVAPLALIMDDTICAWLNLHAARQAGRVPTVVDDMLTDHTFDVKAAHTDPELEDLGFFDRGDALDELEAAGLDIFPLEDFDGMVSYLDENLNDVRTELYNNGFILLLEPEMKPDFFAAPYTRLEDIITEFRRNMSLTKAIPEGFAWDKHIVRVSGTYLDVE